MTALTSEIITVKLSAGGLSRQVQWISPEAAAKFLGVSRWTVIRSLKSGHIKGRKVSAKRWQVDAASLNGA